MLFGENILRVNQKIRPEPLSSSLSPFQLYIFMNLRSSQKSLSAAYHQNCAAVQLPKWKLFNSKRLLGQRLKILFGTIEQNLPQPFLKILFWPHRQEWGVQGGISPLLRS